MIFIEWQLFLQKFEPTWMVQMNKLCIALILIFLLCFDQSKATLLYYSRKSRYNLTIAILDIIAITSDSPAHCSCSEPHTMNWKCHRDLISKSQNHAISIKSLFSMHGSTCHKTNFLSKNRWLSIQWMLYVYNGSLKFSLIIFIAFPGLKQC